MRVISFDPTASSLFGDKTRGGEFHKAEERLMFMLVFEMHVVGGK
jgi:hypothetical protein